MSNAITTSAGGLGGALTLQAGRSVLINANITTDNGALSLIANDLLANGVVDADRLAGSAVIAMAGGTTIDTGSGNFSAELRAGTGKTNTASGAIALGTVTSTGTCTVNGANCVPANHYDNNGHHDLYRYNHYRRAGPGDQHDDRDDRDGLYRDGRGSAGRDAGDPERLRLDVHPELARRDDYDDRGETQLLGALSCINSRIVWPSAPPSPRCGRGPGRG